MDRIFGSKATGSPEKWEPTAKRTSSHKLRDRVRRCIFPQYTASAGSSEIRSMESETADVTVDLISCLPKELAIYILAKLEAPDLLHASQTCRTWRLLAEDDVLWRIKNRKISLPDERHVFVGGSLSLDGFQRSLWKMNFIRHYRINENWRNGTNRATRSLPAHQAHLITCLLFTDDNRIVSGSDDKFLKVWSVETGQCVLTLQGHTGGVWTAELEGNLLVSGSVDKSVRVWNLENGDLVFTGYGHSSTVRCLAIKNGLCVSGSRDFTLRIWRVSLASIFSAATSQNGCIGVLFGHTAAVKCVRYDGSYVVSGSYDHQIRVWNPVDFKCLHVLTGHTERIYSLQFDGVHVVSGSLDTSIRVWDVKTGALKHVLLGHESLISGMHQRDHILVSGNADSTVRLWDIRTGVCLQTLGTDGVKHASGVTSVHIDKNFVVTASDDGTVKLWDLHTGRFIRDIVVLRRPEGVVWKIVASKTKLVCAVGTRDRHTRNNSTQATKILLFDFETNLPTWGHPFDDRLSSPS